MIDQSKALESLRRESWPFPRWQDEAHAPTRKVKDYEDYFASLLRTRYTELESEFQITFLAPSNVPNTEDVHPIPKRIFNLLLSAGQELKRHRPNLLSVSSTLELVDRYLIWLYHPSILQAKIPRIISLLESHQVEGKEKFIDRLSRFSMEDLDQLNMQYGVELDSDSSALLKQLRSVLDEATSSINKKIAQEQTNSGLQIERLKTLRTWGIILLAVLLLVSPLVSNLEEFRGWPARLVAGGLGGIAAWITFSALAIVGALGGFFSGLLQARSSRITLTQYQENMLKLQLKPLVGALVSLVLSVLLSWQILPGITAENAGSYVLFAFLSGFSERYFLRLLVLKADSEAVSTQEDVSSLAGVTSS
jgi:hypothetical protein